MIKKYVLETHVSEEKSHSSTHKAKRDAYMKHDDDVNKTVCLMLDTMNYELQNKYENMAAFKIIEHLKRLYQEQVRHKRFEFLQSPFSRKAS